MDMNPKVFGRVLGGLVLLAIGGMFLLRQLGYVSFDFDIGYLISTFWPLILIAVGVQSMMQRGGGWWGVFLLGLGVFFQIRNLGFIDLSIGDVFRYGWPVLLIWWGLSMILRPGTNKKSDGGWQSYPPKTGDRPVPPPPPLHPNPLDLDYEPPKAGESGADGNPGAAGHHGAGGHHGANPHHGADGHHGAGGWHGNGGAGGAGSWNGAGGWSGPGPKHAADDERHDWAHANPNAENRSGFIGDIHLGGDYWELRPMNISLFIGDTVLDLTKAQIPCGETRINISSFIGDVKVFVPNDRDLGLSVISSSFIGDTRVYERHEGGFFKHVKFETPYYHEADKRIRLNVSSFIGDVRIVKVG
jgi:lia operon protein LiaF